MAQAGEVRLEPRLAPGCSPEVALGAVLEAGEGVVLVVGHEPLLSEMTGLLVGEGLRLELRKGGLVELQLISRTPPRGVLLGLLRPAHLR